MKKKLRVLMLVVVVLSLIITMTMVACKPKKVDLNKVVDKDAPAIVYPNYDGGDTLVVGYSHFSNVFSPFFSKTEYDSDVAGMTQVSLLTTDRAGAIVLNGIEGEKIKYNGKEYEYKGISNLKVTQNANDSVYYDFQIRDDLFFSDGKHLTIDDAIFSMYVLSDPSYTGSSTFYTLPIKGMKDYRAGVTSDIYEKYSKKADAILKAGKDGPVTSAFTAAEQKEYYGNSFKNAGLQLAQDIIDYVSKEYTGANFVPYMGPLTPENIVGHEGKLVAYAMRMWGFGSWNQIYPVDVKGTLGKIDNKYQQLYVKGGDEENNSFKIGEQYYTKATEASAKADLVYISTKDDKGVPTAVAAYTGDRHKMEYDGFTDSKGTVFNLKDKFPTKEIYWDNIFAAYEYDFAGIQQELPDENAVFTDSIKEFFIRAEGPKDMEGGAISNIAGIQKTDTYTMRIEMEKFDASAIYKLGISVAPLHYYGSRDAYKYTENKFGFTKGDLKGVESKTKSPLGAGPYKFKSFEQGVVHFERNGYYFKGCPNITNIQFKETGDADKIPGAIGKTFDITDPSMNKEAVKAIQKANGVTESETSLNLGDKLLKVSLVDNLGYGYIGINAKNVSVNNVAGSNESKNLRKAFATVFAVGREPAINSYYGPLASVINYPISNTSWAAPQPADESYALAYSKDVNGKDIYTAEMNQVAREAAAKKAALGFLAAAGYTLNADKTKVTKAPAGAKLEYEVVIPGENKGEHPAIPVFTTAKAILDQIGITLNLNDPADSNVLWDKLNAGTQELWAAAWGAAVDPDMHQVYHSSNIVGRKGTDNNHYGIDDKDLDAKIMAARESDDQNYRKGVYKECLETIMSWGVEIPTYQRKNAVVFNNTRVIFASITPDITTFWGWMNDIEAVKMHKK